MRKFGLIGYPLGHSFSQKYFTEKFERELIDDAEYELFPLENIDDVRLVFEIHKNLHGLNVTIPYKETVIQYLDELDPTAIAIGAVNCIKIEDPEFSRIKKGYNTDVYGFRDAIAPMLKPHHQQALVLGTGGSSKAVQFALKDLNIPFQLVSRNAAENVITYPDINKSILDEFPVIINCTPAGMYPEINSAPALPYQFLSPHHFCFDLVYNPEITLFLQRAKDHGATIKSGLDMLHSQAEYAWKLWNTSEEED